jgi:hypothetical protein
MMSKLTTWMAAGALALLAPVAASATVLNFDNLGSDGSVPASYGGLDWSAGGWSYYTYTGDAPPYTPHSGDGRATMNWYDDADAAAAKAASHIGFGKDVVFDGAYFAGLTGATVQYQLFLDGALVWTSAVLDPTAAPAFLASGYAGLVDAVEFVGPALYGVVMDDFTFNAVPEPASGALLLAGLAGITLVTRRRQRG